MEMRLKRKSKYVMSTADIRMPPPATNTERETHHPVSPQAAGR